MATSLFIIINEIQKSITEAYPTCFCYERTVSEEQQNVEQQKQDKKLFLKNKQLNNEADNTGDRKSTNTCKWCKNVIH